eukprot:GHVU01067795.1.p1 GENE.GHVU01067795.1~~GHVU01067795.1.p1  ORF type:complete len:138 (+),score=5.28 GHVU01067795.1:3-416(+)
MKYKLKPNLASTLAAPPETLSTLEDVDRLFVLTPQQHRNGLSLAYAKDREPHILTDTPRNPHSCTTCKGMKSYDRYMVDVCHAKSVSMNSVHTILNAPLGHRHVAAFCPAFCPESQLPQLRKATRQLVHEPVQILDY